MLKIKRLRNEQMKFLLFISIFGLGSCVSEPMVTAPASVFPGKGITIPDEDGKLVVHRDTLCKKHRVPVKIIDGYRYRGIITGTKLYQEAVKDSPNILGPSFSKTKSEFFTIPTKGFVCPKCKQEYRKLRTENTL